MDFGRQHEPQAIHDESGGANCDGSSRGSQNAVGEISQSYAIRKLPDPQDRMLAPPSVARAIVSTNPSRRNGNLDQLHSASHRLEVLQDSHVSADVPHLLQSLRDLSLQSRFVSMTKRVAMRYCSGIRQPHCNTAPLAFLNRLCLHRWFDQSAVQRLWRMPTDAFFVSTHSSC